MIRVRLGSDLSAPSVNVADLRFTIGRAADNQVVAAAQTVSAHHIEVLWAQSGYRIIDLNSSNGLWLPQGRVREAWLEDSLTCMLGNVPCQLEVCDPVLSSESHGKWLMASEICRFGRAPDNDWVIADAAVSKYHGCFRREGSQILVENISVQGVKADGLPVCRTPLAAGSVVEIGNVRVSLDTSLLTTAAELSLQAAATMTAAGEIDVQVSGILGREQAEQLAATLQQLRSRGAQTVRLELSACRQLHPRSLEVLLDFAGSEAGHRAILLVNPSASVRRALALAHAEQTLPCFRSLS